MEENIYYPLRQFPSSARSLRVAVVTETYPPEINGVALTIEHMVAGLRQRQQFKQRVRRGRDIAQQYDRGGFF